MYYVKHNKSVGQGSARKIIAVMIIVTLIAMFISLNIQMRRIIADSAQVHAQNLFSEAVSQALEQVTADCGFEMVHVNKSDSGQVISVETNTALVNKIRSEVSITLIDILDEASTQPVRVSLGTLIGIDALAGLGPKIEMRFELRGGVSTDVVSDLRETGINQSLHTIDCVVSADYFVILPGYRFTAELSSTVPLAQSVIVGEVPDAYTYVVGDESDTISRIFDYAHLEP